MTIEELINAEGDNIEFKLDLPQKDIGFLKTVVAFSNGQGGKIVFGIRNEDHVIIGMDDETLFQDIDTITNIIARMRFHYTITVTLTITGFFRS